MDDELEDLNREQFARRLANLVRIGVVEAADYSAATVRVRISSLLTDWIPWTSVRAGLDRDWCPPEVGEQVLVVSPSGHPELGIVIASLFCDVHPVNGNRAGLRRVTFADGTVCEYDRAAHALNITVPESGGTVTVNTGGEIVLSADTQITLNAPQIVIEGPVTQTQGDITSDGVSLQTHTHGGVESGAASTSPPN